MNPILSDSRTGIPYSYVLLLIWLRKSEKYAYYLICICSLFSKKVPSLTLGVQYVPVILSKNYLRILCSFCLLFLSISMLLTPEELHLPCSFQSQPAQNKALGSAGRQTNLGIMNDLRLQNACGMPNDQSSTPLECGMAPASAR